jgi:hypothetical protein
MSINTQDIIIKILLFKIKFKMLKVSIFALVFLVTICISQAQRRPDSSPEPCKNYECPREWIKTGKSIPILMQ